MKKCLIILSALLLIEAAAVSVFAKKKVRHEYVDVGLSVMWSTCNIDADSPLELGHLYRWDGFNGTTFPEPGTDVAHNEWGDAWRTPTSDEIIELLSYCTLTWVNNADSCGFKVTSNIEGFTDSSIFIPAQFSRTPISEIVTTSTGGHRFEVVDYHNEYSGNYLSSSIEDSLHRPVYLDILDGYFEMKKSGQWPRFNSFYIRPVMPLDPATIQNRVLPQVELIETNYVYDGEIDISEFEGLGEIVDDSLLQ